MTFDKTAYQREYMKHRRGKRGDGRESVTIEEEERYDPKRYPERKAWEIAVSRAMRAKAYAVKFPQFIRKNDLKFQDISWQYENEGIKAVKRKESYLST